MKYFDRVEEKLQAIRTGKQFEEARKQLEKEYAHYTSPEVSEDAKCNSYHDFMVFSHTGSRKEYEGHYFLRRRRLTLTFMAALIFEEQTYVDELCEAVWDILKEISWVIPAHLHGNLGMARRHIDLFAAETGLYLSEVLYFMEDKLPQNLKDLIRVEVEERIFRTMDDYTNWWESLDSNWAAVCAGSVGMTYLYLAPERFATVRERILKCMQNYMSGITDDGCCTEGMDYWYYGYWFYMNFADMYYRFTDGKEDIRAGEKQAKLAMFLQNTTLIGEACVSFSDASRTRVFDHPGFYSYLKQCYPSFQMPKGCEMDVTLSKLSWVLRDFLWQEDEEFWKSYDEKAKNSGEPKGQTDTIYYESAKWYIHHEKEYAFAAKAGHNEEQHNHNDIGSFIIATKDGQMLRDIGSAEYTRDSFDPANKYMKVFNASSLGHSVPIVDGLPQHGGREFEAKNVVSKEKIFAMELQGAYETDIEKIDRKFCMSEEGVLLTDTYSNIQGHEITERFVSVVKPEIAESAVTIGGVRLVTENLPEITVKTISDHACQPLDVYCLDYKVDSPVFEIRFEVVIGE